MGDEDTTTLEVLGLMSVSSIIISNCSSLSNISMPQLISLSENLIIQQNPALASISFPKVQTVGGNLDITGTFNALSFLDLISIGGGLNVQTSSSSFQCPFPDAKKDGTVHGDTFTCAGNIAQPTSISGENETIATEPSATSTTAHKASSASPSPHLSWGEIVSFIADCRRAVCWSDFSGSCGVAAP